MLVVDDRRSVQFFSALTLHCHDKNGGWTKLASIGSWILLLDKVRTYAGRCVILNILYCTKKKGITVKERKFELYT